MNKEFQSRKRAMIALGSACFTCLLIFVGVIPHQYIDLIIVIPLFAMAFVLFKGKIFSKTAVILLSYILIMFLEICSTSLLSIVFDMSYNDIVLSRDLHILVNFGTVLLVGFGVAVKNATCLFRDKRGISKKVFLLIFAGITITTFLVGSLILIDYPGLDEGKRATVLIIMVIVSFVFLGACLLLLLAMDSRDNYRFLNQTNQVVIEAQQKYYALAQEKQDEIHSIRHEIRNHLYCIRSLYSMGKFEEMNQYLNQLIEEANNLTMLYDTGNDLVNSIINDMATRYQEYKVGIILEGGFPSELNIAPMDLCIIFSNGLMNAVEAILKISNPTGKTVNLRIKISTYKDDLYIDIWNPVAEEVKILNNRLNTSKEDKNSHGFGTQNMRMRVEKYKGTIEFSCKEKEFHCSIFMKNKEPQVTSKLMFNLDTA